jgi:hypothetical protein
MMGTKHSRSNPSGLSGGRLLALLLVFVILMSHGAFGALHLARGAQQLPANQIYESPTPLKGKGEGTYKHPLLHSVHASNYYTVLLVSFLGLVLGLLLKLLKGARSWNITTTSLTFDRRHRPFGLSSLPRGPSAPLLQVLRL